MSFAVGSTKRTLGQRRTPRSSRALNPQNELCGNYYRPRVGKQIENRLACSHSADRLNSTRARLSRPRFVFRNLLTRQNQRSDPSTSRAPHSHPAGPKYFFSPLVLSENDRSRFRVLHPARPRNVSLISRPRLDHVPTTIYKLRCLSPRTDTKATVTSPTFVRRPFTKTCGPGGINCFNVQ